MYLRRKAVIRCFIASFIGAVLYCEWFVYVIKPLYWQKLECQNGPCTKILFIADPQIQGELFAPFPLNYLFIWDSDRYLKSTFSIAVKYFNPHVLVYLGDLMDEGSVASKLQYDKYINRLFDIFKLDNPIVQIWVPGDNDIGGENEPIKPYKIEDFEMIFPQPSIITHRNISFYKVNAITQKIPKLEDNNNSTLNYKIAVSHYPVTTRYSFGNQVNNEIHPNVYFCAHDHISRYVVQDKRNLSNKRKYWLHDKDIISVPTNEELLYEINVPTCSYRMGTNKIGFGAAILENDRQYLRYTVFWSPERFPCLFFYLFILIIVLVFGLASCSVKLVKLYNSQRCCLQNMYFLRSSGKTPHLNRV